MAFTRIPRASSSAFSLDSQIILGLITVGLALTIVVLVLYAYVAWHPTSRRYLDRVSFRLLVYTLLAHLVFGITFPIGMINAHPGWACNLVSFIFNLSLMFSAGMFFCMAINLPLVLVYRVNGQRMEKYYILGTSVVCTACAMSAYASGSLGWNAFSRVCWYASNDPAVMLRWVIGTQTFWILLVSVGEVIAFLTIMGYMIAYQLVTRCFTPQTQQSASENLHTTGLTIVMFRNIILRIGLYPLVSCLLNIYTALLNVYLVQHPELSDLTGRLGFIDLVIFSARPLIYGVLAATDPSFLRGLRERRHPASSYPRHSYLTTHFPAPCLSTVLSMPHTEQTISGGEKMEGTSPALVGTHALGQGDVEEFSDGEYRIEATTANTGRKATDVKLGIKLFSVSASEMCDERTASKMGMWSTAKRNGLGPFSIIDMGILEKYWKYGFNSGNVYTHTARLNLDQYDIEAGPPRTLPVPTLQDLLNPIPMAADPSEDSLFNNPDPYGHVALDEDEESDAEDLEMAEADPSPRTASVRGPRVVRLSDAPRLAIEEYVNLQATALLARLEPTAPHPRGHRFGHVVDLLGTFPCTS
ncbi:hypothetical protein DFH09DRAFT_1409646 [Mycena vulgaris]|nr:hypothetical protein DFH09DRAFT_1409646 [Mycena vulgaris]